MKKIKLHVSESRSSRGVSWKTGPAFWVNPRGYLVHRVRSITTHAAGHTSCIFQCGNLTCSGHATDSPPEDLLVCAACEGKAKERGLPSADELAGRHVHIGRLRPERLCCKNDDN